MYFPKVSFGYACSRFAILSLFASLTLLSACGGGSSSGDDDSNSGQLAANVSPVTNGKWYRPPVNATWTWQIQGKLNTAYDTDIYDIDLFDVSAVAIANLQANGRKVICYFSAGSFEDFRADAGKFDESMLGKTLSGFADERWLDIRQIAVFNLMLDRLDLAVRKGCDGVEPDNVQAFLEDTGFNLTENDQLAFNRNLFNAAHQRGLSVALKNDLPQVDELVDYVDMIVNEQCHQFDECDLMQAFIAAGKPILNAEYKASFQAAPKPVCTDALLANIRTLILSDELDDSVRVSCDQDFPASTRLAATETYVTYYQNDAAKLAELSELDLVIVQPVLTTDQVRALQSHGKAVVYLSIGEIGLSNTYWYNGAQVPGQVVFDDNPGWFRAKNPSFDSYFADAGIAGWQNFIVDQAGILLDQGYDGLFLDTVDTVDVYADTIPGMVALIALLRTTYPDIVLVQNRGINIIEQTGGDVDALMFEVFNSYFDNSLMDYQATDVDAPGYADLVDKALAFRLDGGVVLSQDFALEQARYEELICYARDRALQHLFVPAYADKFFQEGLFEHPDACPWPLQPGFEVAFDAPLLNVSIDSSNVIEVNINAILGFTDQVSLTLGAAPANLAAVLDSTLLTPGQTTNLTVTASNLATADTYNLEVTATSGDFTEVLQLKVVVHDESIWVTNAGLSNVVVLDEPDSLTNPSPVSRKTGEAVAQPYSVAIDDSGNTWVVENVGDPAAAQPAGMIKRYAPYDLSTPGLTLTSNLNYPTGIARASDGRVWIANSALDWTGTPRGAPSIVTIASGTSTISAGFTYTAATYGYPKQLAVDTSDTLWVTTTFGLVLGFIDPDTLTGNVVPDSIIVAVGGDADFLNTLNNLVFDAAGDLWVSGSFNGVSRVIEINAASWANDGSLTTLNDTDVQTVLSDDLFTPWGLAFDASGNLWVVNSTDADDNSDSKGSLLRFDGSGLTTGATPDRNIELESRFTLGIAIARP